MVRVRKKLKKSTKGRKKAGRGLLVVAVIGALFFLGRKQIIPMITGFVKGKFAKKTDDKPTPPTAESA